MKTAATLMAVLAAAMPPIFPPITPSTPPERMTENWDERRYVEFLARTEQLDMLVPTASGAIADLQTRGDVYDVALDSEWRAALSNAMLLGISTERKPGVWLLCPDARTQEYLECQVVVQWLRSYGVPMQIRTLAVPVEPVVPEVSK